MLRRSCTREVFQNGLSKTEGRLLKRMGPRPRIVEMQKQSKTVAMADIYMSETGRDLRNSSEETFMEMSFFLKIPSDKDRRARSRKGSTLSAAMFTGCNPQHVSLPPPLLSQPTLTMANTVMECSWGRSCDYHIL